MCHGRWFAEQLDGPVAVAVVHDRPVVARDDEDRAVGDAEAVEHPGDAAHAPVERENRIAAGSHAAAARKPLVRDTGHVDVVGPEVEEEGPLAVLLDELHGFAGDHVGDLFVLPQRLAAALHVSDARDAVHDRHVVSVAGVQPEQFGVVASGGFAREVLLVAHRDRGLGIVVVDPLVLDVDARHAVARGGHDERIVESDLFESRGDVPVPVLPAAFAQSEVPFAYGTGRVARIAEGRGEGRRAGTDNHARVAGGDARAGYAPRVDARKQAEAGRGARR